MAYRVVLLVKLYPPGTVPSVDTAILEPDAGIFKVICWFVLNGWLGR